MFGVYLRARNRAPFSVQLAPSDGSYSSRLGMSEKWPRGLVLPRGEAEGQLEPKTQTPQNHPEALKRAPGGAKKHLSSCLVVTSPLPEATVSQKRSTGEAHARQTRGTREAHAKYTRGTGERKASDLRGSREAHARHTRGNGEAQAR